MSKLNTTFTKPEMIIIITLILSFVLGLHLLNCKDARTEDHTFSDLLDAIEWVESKGDPDAIGDGGDAVGAYQIHKIYVDDVNRIMMISLKGVDRDEYIPYEYGYRKSRLMSRGMTATYLSHYGGTFEEMARKHNGGPQGHKKEATLPYWVKVKARMEQK